MKVRFKKNRLIEARNNAGYKNNDDMLYAMSDEYEMVKSRQFDNYMKDKEMPFEKLIMIARFLDVNTDYLQGHKGKDGQAMEYPFSTEISFQVDKEKLKAVFDKKTPSFHDVIYGTMNAWLETCGISKTELNNLKTMPNKKQRGKRIYPYAELRERLSEATLKTYSDFIFEFGLDEIRIK